MASCISEYRLHKTKNLNLLRRLHKKCFPADELEDFKRGACWVLYKGKKPVGFCHVRDVLGEIDTCFLARAGVIESERGKGLQKKLIMVRLKWARFYGYRDVITYCSPENVASSNNLISCGFKLYLPEEKWGCKNALYFRRRID